MTDEEVMKLPSLVSIEKHPIKAVLAAVMVGLGSLWALHRPALVDDLSADFFTVARAEAEHQEIKDTMTVRMDVLENKIDDNSTAVKGLQTEVRLTAAFQLERSIKYDLEAHKSQSPETRDPTWREDVSRLERQLILATDYKECVLYERPNCDHLQRQLWQ
jgi:hypothetical protein